MGALMGKEKEKMQSIYSLNAKLSFLKERQKNATLCCKKEITQIMRNKAQSDEEYAKSTVNSHHVQLVNHLKVEK